MKTNLLMLLAFLLSFQVSYGQDIITKKTGEDVKAMVFEVTPTHVKYKRFEDAQGPTFSLPRTELVMVRYENGSKEIFADTTPPTPATVTASAGPATPAATTPVFMQATDAYSQGQSDAATYYKGYKGAGTATLITTLIMPLAGLIPAIACSSTTPKEQNLDYPSSELMKNQDYKNGYTRQARTIKSKKVWKNWGIGFGVILGLVILTN